LTGYWIGCEDSNGYLCLIGEPLVSPTKIDGPVGDRTFLSRHSPDMKFTHIDERFVISLGFLPQEYLSSCSSRKSSLSSSLNALSINQ